MLENLGRTTRRAGELGTERGCRGRDTHETSTGRFELTLNRCKCAYHITSRCCGGRHPSSMVVRGSALIVHSQDFQSITCGYGEPSEGVGSNCNSSHLLSISPHHKPSDIISVVDPIWCRVPPGDSDGGSSAACYS